jgi:hypothetical protein
VNGKIIRIGVTSFVTMVLAASVASSFTTVGCGLQCDRNPDQPPVPYKAGVATDAGKPWGSYETTGHPGPFLPFPPGRTYRIFHTLGACPKNVLAYFSFDETPVAASSTAPDQGGEVEAAGNQYTIERLTPDFVDVRNDTCSSVYLRVVASEPDFTGGACSSPGKDAGNARPVAADGAASLPPRDAGREGTAP